jgi:hypothetical protein
MRLGKLTIHSNRPKHFLFWLSYGHRAEYQVVISRPLTPRGWRYPQGYSSYPVGTEFNFGPFTFNRFN